MIGAGGHSGADRDRPRHSGKLPAIDHPPQLLGHGQGMLLAGLREQDGELFSSVAADYIDLPQLLGEDRRHLAQHFIAQQVAEFIVQALELVDIHHDHCHAGVEPPGALQFLLDSQFEVAAVEDSGQAVQIGQMLDALNVVGILNRSGADVGDRLQRLDIAPR